MERILVVASDFPYPLNHGGAIDIWGHIRSLKSLGFDVDLVATVKAKPSEECMRVVSGEVGQLSIVERRRGWRSAATAAPFQVRSRAGLAAVPLSREYAAVILEQEHVAGILQNPGLCARTRILRLQDNEARFFYELSKSARSLWEKMFYRSEAVKFRWLSPAIMDACDALWFISEYEMKEHVKEHPADSGKSWFLPPRVEVTAMRRQSLEGKKALFLGTLGFANNADAVEWYVANVHPSLGDVEGYGFIVAGNTRGSSNGFLNRIIKPHPNIFLYENPKDTEPLYGDAAVFVNPMFHGAGVKLKVFGAIEAGVPVVSTSSGVEGTGLVPGKHLLVADSPRAFGACIRALFNDKGLAQALASEAQDFLAREYDQARIIKNSLAAIHEERLEFAARSSR